MHSLSHTHTQHMSVPSVRMVKGESPSLLAENCPPREVIRKQRLKKPIPTTNILQHMGRREGKDEKGVEMDRHIYRDGQVNRCFRWKYEDEDRDMGG